MKLVFNILTALFMGFLLVIATLLLAPRLPVHTGIESKIVMSGSMSPYIPVGALVFVKPSTSYAVGDVITFGESTASVAPTTHRIVRVRSENGTEFYTTKGDANNAPDSREIPKSDVIGTVFFSLPYAGFVLYFARQPLGFALLIGLPAFLVIISELAAIVQEILNLRRGRRVRTMAKPRRLPAYPIEYVRRFTTDDIFVPVRIFNAQASIVSHNYAGALSSLVAAVSISLIVSLQSAGGTLSYFRDIQVSQGNSFTAAEMFPAAVVATFAQGQEPPTQDTSQGTIGISAGGAGGDAPLQTAAGDTTLAQDVAPAPEPVPSGVQAPLSTPEAGE